VVKRHHTKSNDLRIARSTRAGDANRMKKD